MASHPVHGHTVRAAGRRVMVLLEAKTDRIDKPLRTKHAITCGSLGDHRRQVVLGICLAAALRPFCLSIKS